MRDYWYLAIPFVTLMVAAVHVLAKRSHQSCDASRFCPGDHLG